MSRLPIPTLAVAITCLLGAALSPAVQARALSNDEFAARVQGLRQQIQAQPALLAEVARLCAHLPEHRAVEEPRCVALRVQLRSWARDEGAADAAVDAAAGLVGRLTGRLGRVFSG